MNQFFAVIEKTGHQGMAVHSKGDLDYMIARGWRLRQVDPIDEVVQVKPEIAVVQKRKLGRPRKVK